MALRENRLQRNMTARHHLTNRILSVMPTLVLCISIATSLPAPCT